MTKINFNYLTFFIINLYFIVLFKVLGTINRKMSSIQDSSDLFFPPKSRDVRETGDNISPSYLLYSSREKSPKLPGTNVPVSH